MDILRNISSLP